MSPMSSNLQNDEGNFGKPSGHFIDKTKQNNTIKRNYWSTVVAHLTDFVYFCSL